jgi:hypothetical protein
MRTSSRLLLIIAATLAANARPAAGAGREDDKFFDPAVVQTVHLEIAPADLERLQRALPRRIRVPATFRWNDVTLHSVGLGYKGNSSSAPDSPHKRSFLITFSEFEKGQRFLGLRHVALDNGIQFGSLFSERLITDVLRGLGVKASRCNYARVYLNGKPVGVYVNVERIDRSFLERHFDSAQGALFKVDEGGPGADLRYQGSDPAGYRQAFELHAGNDREAFAALIEFIHAIDTPKASGDDLRQILEVDAFLDTTAVMLFAGAFDQYTGWGPHNYYLYRNPSNRRWTYLPWDLDVGFADRAFDRVPVLDGWHAAWPAPIPGTASALPGTCAAHLKNVVPSGRAHPQVAGALWADSNGVNRGPAPSASGYRAVRHELRGHSEIDGTVHPKSLRPGASPIRRSGKPSGPQADLCRAQVTRTAAWTGIGRRAPRPKGRESRPERSGTAVGRPRRRRGGLCSSAMHRRRMHGFPERHRARWRESHDCHRSPSSTRDDLSLSGLRRAADASRPPWHGRVPSGYRHDPGENRLKQWRPASPRGCSRRSQERRVAFG